MSQLESQFRRPGTIFCRWLKDKYGKVPLGTLVLDAEFAAKLLQDGFNFVACGSDTALLARGTDNLLASVNNALNISNGN